MGDGKTRAVKYVPSEDDDFAKVIAAVQAVLPQSIEFRFLTSSRGTDGLWFAALLREEWAALQALDADAINAIFEPL